MKRRLGNLERQLLAYAQLRKVRELRTGDLTRPLGITAKQERELYSRLARAGLIAQVRRGLYLIPRELPLGGAWTPDEALALNTLMADRAAAIRSAVPMPSTATASAIKSPTGCTPTTTGYRAIGAITLTLIKGRRPAPRGHRGVHDARGPDRRLFLPRADARRRRVRASAACHAVMRGSRASWPNGE